MRMFGVLRVPVAIHTVLVAGAGLTQVLQDPVWEGKIVAVFHTGLLLSGPAQTLLHVHGGAFLASPFSLRVTGTLSEVLQRTPPVTGMIVRKAGPALEIPGHVRLRLDAVSYYRSPGGRTAEVDPEALLIAKRIVSCDGHPQGVTALPGIQAVIPTLQRAVRGGSPDQLCDAARRIIGLGPGLTPSGDDFLVGFLRGLWFYGAQKPAVHAMLSRLRSDLTPCLPARTTRLGAEFIRYALAGAFAEVLDQAATSLMSLAQADIVVSAIKRLIAQGETSGTDTTQGLLACLEALP